MHEFTPQDIRSLRLRLGDNPTRFAARLDVSENTVRRWEIGDRHPNYHALRKLRKLAVKVGMSPSGFRPASEDRRKAKMRVDVEGTSTPRRSRVVRSPPR